MSIVLKCPCGKQLRVADEFAGRRAKCPACNAVLPIPALATLQPEPRPGGASEAATMDFPSPPAKAADPSTLDGPASMGVKTPSFSGQVSSEALTRDFKGPVVTSILSVNQDFGDYELLQEVARGGMGVVFKARQKSLGRIVALKMILAGQLASPEQVRRFHQEAEEAGQLDHPNIVPIFQVGELKGQHFFSMKLIEGGSLASTIADRQWAMTDWPRTARLIGAVARAVHYAHQRGVLHRDLKPGNILLDKEGQPHVTDFGLAKHLGTEGGTQSGAILGTPGYMAPEQAAGEKNLTVAADVHGLGAILYELLSGHAPFEGDTAMGILHQVIERDAAPLRKHNPKVPADLETIAHKCLQKDPGKRYSSALALAEDLERFHNREPIRARPITSWERTVKWARRRPAWAALVAVVALAAFALGVGGWFYNVRLRAEVARANEKEKEARDAREASEQAFRKGLGSIDDMLINLDGRLANKEGMESVRVEFLREFQRFGELLLQDRPNDPVARRQLGRVAARVGDVFAQNQSYDSSDEAFGEAVSIQQALAREFPGETQYQSDLALTHAQHARTLLKGGQAKRGLTALQAAVHIQDKLAAESPAHSDIRAEAERYRFELANALEEDGQAEPAKAAYAQALKALEVLTRLKPSPALHGQLARAADSLGSLVLEKEPAGGLRLLWESLHHRREAWRAAPHVAEHENDYRSAYSDLSAVFRKGGLHAELARLSDQVLADAPDPKGDVYNAACIMGMAAQAAADKKLADDYAEKAVMLLQKAGRAGYPGDLSERQHINTDPDLDALRGRADFKAHLAKLDERFPAPPLTPSQQVAAISQEYQNANTSYRRALASAETAAQKRRAADQQPFLSKHTDRVLLIAERHRDQPAALEALTWVLQQTDSPRISDALKKHRAQALQMLERDHLGRKDLSEVCLLLGRAADPVADRLLAGVEAKNPDAAARGAAMYALALSWCRQADRLLPKNPQLSASLKKQAEQKLQAVVDGYASTMVNNVALGEVCKRKLVEVRHLEVGSVAQEIEGEDLDGKRFKLSDYRGKVVVVDFWANWCGYCRMEYENSKGMVERLKDKPFVLLGVNCDDSKATVQGVVKRRGLNWRSWYDGTSGRITGPWQVDSYPTIYVIDAKGVIRHKELRGKQLEAAVVKLLQEK